MKIELPRTSSSSNSSTRNIIPSNYTRSSSYISHPTSHNYKPMSNDKPLATVQNHRYAVALRRFSPTRISVSTFLHSLVNLISFPTILPTCRWLTQLPSQISFTPQLGRKVTGTLFGNRRGHVTFAIQDDPRAAPVFLIELAVTTAALVKEMSSGLVRIALECQKGPAARGRPGKLFKEPMWIMHCNGRKCGYALSRACTESDWHVLSTVQSVSVGAGVIPVVADGRKGSDSDGELLYMRARFERVVGTQNSEAYYMMNPDGNGGPDLSIFLLRV